MGKMKTGRQRVFVKEATEKIGLFGGWPIVLEVDLVQRSLSLCLHKGTLPSKMLIKKIKSSPPKQTKDFPLDAAEFTKLLPAPQGLTAGQYSQKTDSNCSN